MKCSNLTRYVGLCSTVLISEERATVILVDHSNTEHIEKHQDKEFQYTITM